MLQRRVILGAGLAALARPALAQPALAQPALAQPALAQPAPGPAWPTRPIRFVSPWPPGGPADLISRPLAERLTQALGQPVVVENRAGAGGTIATASVARAAPDGYTVLFSQAGPTTITPNFQSVPYDPQRDLLPVTQLVSSGLVLVVRPGIPAATVPELVAYARAARPELTFGSIGPASTTHLAGEMLKRAAEVPMLHVPYTGSTQPITDMMAGRLDLGFWNVSAVMGFIQGGQLRPLAVTTLRRSSRLPELPAMAEFYPGFEVNSWYGVMVPAGTPPAIVERLYRAFTAALRSPDISARLVEAGLEIEGTDPVEYGRRIAAELRSWGELARATGIRSDG